MKLADELRSIETEARNERDKLDKYLLTLPDWLRTIAKSEQKPGESGHLLIANTLTEWKQESMIKIEEWLKEQGINYNILKEGTEDKLVYPMYVSW